ncbi:MAG: hypothetical protein J1E85_05760 [Ruminococcus sp.]|nr:hypothetical protein [Ruminococcus sp.]
MKRVNFDKLKLISTPDEWLENAINIPEKKKVVPFYKHTSILTSAACVALCMIVSIVILFNSFPNKSLSLNNLLSNTVQMDNEDITITSQKSTLQSNTSQGRLDNSDNQRSSQTTQTVTEPSENRAEISTHNIADGAHTAKENFVSNNTSQNSNVGGNKQSTTVKSNLSATENTEETELVFFPDSGPVSGDKPSTKPTQSVPQTTAPDGVYSNPIYLHLSVDSSLDYSNTVGCHLKETYGEDLYSYKSEYEHCDVDIFVDNESSSVKDICITYQNKGPRYIQFGFYEVTFYDVHGNTIFRTIDLYNNNSVHILYE